MNANKIHHLIDNLVQAHDDLSHYKRFDCCETFRGEKAARFNRKRANKKEAILELEAAKIKCEIKQYVLDDGIVTGKMRDFADTFNQKIEGK